MADIILSPIAELIVETLGTAAVQEIKSLWGVRDDLEGLESTLSTIRAVLVDAEKKQIRDKHVRVWLQKLEDVLNDADDLVDEVNTEGLRRQLMHGKKIRKKVRTFFSSNNQLVFRRKMAREIKNIRASLDAISADKQHFHLEVAHEIQPERNARETGTEVDEENVVGRENLRMPKLEETVRENINGKRFLLILDDVWNQEINQEWEKLKGLLGKYCVEGSRVIVTTRHDMTLKLNKCISLRELPSEIEKLVNLRHLELEGCDKITHMPRGLNQLTNLQSLPLVVLSENGPKSPCRNLDELMGLNNLKGELKIKGIRSGMATTATKLRENNRLRFLHLIFKTGDHDASKWKTTIEGLQPHPNLRELTLEQYGGTSLSGFLPTLTNLVKLWLRDCSKCQQLPSLDKFHSLKEMSLINLPSLEYITINEGDNCLSSSPPVSVLPSLQTLNLVNLPEFRGWWRSGMTENQVKQLQLLSFPPLSSLTIREEASPLSKLTNLRLSNVTDVEYFPDERLKGLASLKRLYIRFWPALKYLYPWILYLTSLEDLYIIDCKEFEGIKWPETPTLTRLRVLKLGGLPKLKDVFAPDIQCLTSLEELEIDSCERLEEIKLTPALTRLRVLKLGGLPKLKDVFAPDIQCLTSLEKLEIYWCEGLEEIKLTPALPRLRVLILRGLTKLKHLSSPGIQQHLTSLEELVIADCEELQVSNDDSIEWQALTTLRFLDFSFLPQPVSLPGGLQFLTTLKQLHILDCPNFTGLPDWICKLSSLKNLYIDDCPKFKSVPASLSSLTSLQKLRIHDKYMNPREIHEDLDISSASGSCSWKISNKFGGLGLCNK
ncbi:hypothetical protein TIFTF001_027641 [Ficus carica]|uniref:Uncharacterized protein n=1 Tax=Ficus carica TaxID=3494 RepID=A0AA88DNF7_FICCA|nr:hypothetical protein TIFTF001_027641 [Ficus carica]